jgi:hypothetical protein
MREVKTAKSIITLGAALSLLFAAFSLHAEVHMANGI